MSWWPANSIGQNKNSSEATFATRNLSRLRVERVVFDDCGFRGCGFFLVRDGLIVHQRGYWDSGQLGEAHPGMHDDQL